jgi:hypothetical protein
MPAPEIFLDQDLCFGWPPGAGLIGERRHLLLFAGFNELITPSPAFLNLLATDKQRLVTLNRVKEKTFIGIRDAVKIAAFSEVQIQKM